MKLKVYVDGQYFDKEQAKISVFDHGLLYGDGVFEGIRSYDSLVFQLDKHIDRLYRSAEGIELGIPLNKEEMKKAVIDILKVNKLKDAYIRLIVTRGTGTLGLDPYKCSRPSVIIITDKIALYPKEFYEKGLRIIVAETRRNSSLSLPPTIKSLNYLNNILGKIEAIKLGVKEALMLNSEGYVAECTGDNIFIVKNKKLITPLIEAGALEGITREVVIEIAKNKGIESEQKFLEVDEVYSSDECFLTGTAAEIIPVTEIDHHKIGDGTPGELTRDFINEFRRLTKIKGTKYDL
jgi:branched-chain amino acid aminotransferase